MTISFLFTLLNTVPLGINTLAFLVRPHRAVVSTNVQNKQVANIERRVLNTAGAYCLESAWKLGLGGILQPNTKRLILWRLEFFFETLIRDFTFVSNMTALLSILILLNII